MGEEGEAVRGESADWKGSPGGAELDVLPFPKVVGMAIWLVWVLLGAGGGLVASWEFGSTMVVSIDVGLGQGRIEGRGSVAYSGFRIEDNAEIVVCRGDICICGPAELDSRVSRGSGEAVAVVRVVPRGAWSRHEIWGREAGEGTVEAHIPGSRTLWRAVGQVLKRSGGGWSAF